MVAVTEACKKVMQIQAQAGNQSLPLMKSTERNGATSLSVSCLAHLALLSVGAPGP